MRRSTIVRSLLVLGVLALIGLRFGRFQTPTPPLSQVSEMAGRIAPEGTTIQMARGLTGNSPQVLHLRWSYAAGDLLPLPPAVADDWVYVVAGNRPDTGRLLALDSANGRLRWEHRLNSIADHAPVLTADYLYIGTRNGVLQAMDRRTAQVIWSVETEGAVAGHPTVDRGVLYYGADAVYALDAMTGALRWRHVLEGRVVHGVAYAADVVAAFDATHQIYLLDATRGRRRLIFPLWFNPLGGPVVAGDTLTIAGDHSNVQALKIDGQDVWMEKTVRFWWTRMWLYGTASRPPLPRGYAWQIRDLDGISSRIAAANQNTFFLVVEDAAAKQPSHREANQATEIGQSSAPTEQSPRGRLVAIDSATGALRWLHLFPAMVTPTATLVDGMVLVGTNDGLLWALDQSSGELLWQVKMPGEEPAGPMAAPAIAGPLLLVAQENGHLTALELGRVDISQPSGGD